MKKILLTLIFFTVVKCVGQPLFYGYANIKAKQAVVGQFNTYDVTINNFKGGLRPYPQNKFTENDVEPGFVFFAQCIKFTIQQVITKVPLVVRIVDNSGTTALSSSNLIGYRIAIGKEILSGNISIGFSVDVADGNGSILAGISPSDAACINNYYLNNIKNAIASGGSSGNSSAVDKICGDPVTKPIAQQSYIIQDSCSDAVFVFSLQKNTWTCINDFVSETSPESEFINPSQVKVVKRVWKKLSTGEMYDAIGGVWVNRKNWAVDSLLKFKNSFLEEITFNKKIIANDTVDAKKGVNSQGLINTKGMKSVADSSSVAIESNGAMKGKYKLIDSNDSLDTKDFFIEIRCSTQDLYIKCPPLTSKFKDVFYTIKRTDNTNYIAYFQRPDGTFKRVISKSSGILRFNDEDNNWNFD